MTAARLMEVIMHNRIDTRCSGNAAVLLRTMGSNVTRRTLGGVLLGGLASVGVRPPTSGEASTKAEPDGPDHCRAAR